MLGNSLFFLKNHEKKRIIFTLLPPQEYSLLRDVCKYRFYYIVKYYNKYFRF